MNSDIQVRPAHAEDAVEIAALIRQLGYAVAPDALRGKLTQWADGAAGHVLVAESGARLLGCIGLHVTPMLHVEGALGRITALVVGEEYRGRGIGHKLMMSAHAWFEAAGCVRFEVTSGDHREQAHRFYERHGYLRQGRRLARMAA